MFSYGTKSLDRLAFQKALDDIAAEESAGFEFSLEVLKPDFSRGVQLLADNELNPRALPNEAFQVIKPQTAQYFAGRMKSPGYQTTRALSVALFPAKDPSLREATPQTVSSVTLDDVKQYYAKTFRPDLTTIVVIGDISPEEARTAIEKWFGGWKSSPAPNRKLTCRLFPPIRRPQPIFLIPASFRIRLISPKQLASRGLILTIIRFNWETMCLAAVSMPRACITTCVR